MKKISKMRFLVIRELVSGSGDLLLYGKREDVFFVRIGKTPDKIPGIGMT